MGTRLNLSTGSDPVITVNGNRVLHQTPDCPDVSGRGASFERVEQIGWWKWTELCKICLPTSEQKRSKKVLGST